MSDDKTFVVYTYEEVPDLNALYAHWSEGLRMVIEKDGVKMELDSNEIAQLVSVLPRTMGNVY